MVIEVPVLPAIGFFLIFGFFLYRTAYYEGLDGGFRKALSLMEEAELSIMAQRIQNGVDDE